MAVSISFRDIPDDIGTKYLPYEPTLRQKQRGVAFSSGSYLHSVTFHSFQDNIVSICGKIYRSQRKSEAPHVINIALDKILRSFTDAHCSCKCGASGKCSHVLALVLILEGWKISGYQAIPSQPSSTSLPQQWDKPRGPKIESEAVSQIIIARPGNLNRKRRPVMATFNDNRKVQVQESDMSLLHSMKEFPISYLTDTYSSSHHTVDTPIGPQIVGSSLGHQVPLIKPTLVPKMEDRCGDVLFPKDDNIPELEAFTPLKHHWRDLELSSEDSYNLEKNTRSQINSDLWYKARKVRITASNFGMLMKRKKQINDTFMRNTFDKKNFCSDPTSYGISNEKIAKQMYIKKTQNHLHDIGFVVNPAIPFIGATPDAIVCDTSVSGILEIKCPYSVRDLTIDEASCRTDFFLKKEGKYYTLKRSEKHWYQVQGQLLVTGAPFCDFVTYTRQDLNIERIYPDMNTFSTLLDTLSRMYVNHFKPYFARKHIS